MKRQIFHAISIILLSMMFGCREGNQKDYMINAVSVLERTFWGDSATVFVSKKLSNGYNVTLIRNKDLCLIHFVRGDSINRYCALHELPDDIHYFEYEDDSIGVYSVNVDFPVYRGDSLGGSEELPNMFFMDVNFDGEEEFVVQHDGYNRNYYACFDLVNGNQHNSCPGLLECLSEEPYNNLVAFGPDNPCHTVFNRKKKEIYVYETMGCCSYFETWAKYFEGDIYGNEAQVKVTKREEHSWGTDGTEYVDTYMLENDTLKLVSQKEIKAE